MDFPPDGILWGMRGLTTTRREAMFCQAGFDQWLRTIMHHLPHLSKPQATVLALWSFGMVLARSCALTAVSHLLAKGMKRKEQTVRQQLREWYYDTPRKRGPKRQALHVETCFPVLLGWVVSWWQGTQLALAIDATALGTRFVVLAVSVVYRGCAIPVAWVWPGSCCPPTPNMPGGANGCGCAACGQRFPATGRSSSWRIGACMRRGCFGGSSRWAGTRFGASIRAGPFGLPARAACAPCRALCPSQGHGGVAGAQPFRKRGGNWSVPCWPCGRTAIRPPG